MKESGIIFGSQDANYPSLQQLTNTTKAETGLKKWPDLLKAGCFDEWIANSDRHNGNILTNGIGNFSLIDHSHAIPKIHPINGCNNRNRFLELIAEEINNDLDNHRVTTRASSQINSFLDAISEDWEALTRGEDYLDPVTIQNTLDFLNRRLPALSELIALHLKNKQGLLYAASA